MFAGVLTYRSRTSIEIGGIESLSLRCGVENFTRSGIADRGYVHGRSSVKFANNELIRKLDRGFDFFLPALRGEGDI